ncbi:MAG: WD40 repeat-like protein [Trizodia sp. TS-e1964]|nr:MAG: WD40 repeat-like protein [Trizodia sp. TS-e1964]
MSIAAEANWAPSPDTTRGQPSQLSSDPKGERIAYASNKSIFLRSIDHPEQSTQYTGHKVSTTVARFSPSGYYVASGDASGNIRVWDCVGEGATKGEYHIISGRINDIAWDGDSQRIIAVGDGKERYGHCITADAGNTVGEISGHSSLVTSVSIRQQRPLRAATVSEDKSLVFYHGAPFKFNTSLRSLHSNFIYGVAFSPDGAHIVSVAADKKIWLYDGKTAEPKIQIGEGEHKGSIFGLSWAKDSTKFVTSSADQTVRIWDVESQKLAHSWRLGSEATVSVPDHQVGVVWPAGRGDDLIISLSLSGDLNYLDQRSAKPTRVLPGHQKNITAVSITGAVDDKTKDLTLWTGSFEGRTCAWDIATGSGWRLNANSHTNYVSALSTTPTSKKVYSAGYDDTLRSIDADTRKFNEKLIKLGAQPKGIAAGGPTSNRVFVATTSGIEIYEDGTTKIGFLSTHYGPTSISVAERKAGTFEVAVGGDDHILRIYQLSLGSSELVLSKEVGPSSSAISALSYSPNYLYLAAGEASGKINVYSTEGYELYTNRWSAHTARVACIAWNSSGTLAASAGLDTSICVWSTDKAHLGRRIVEKNAHKDGVNGVVWAGPHKVISVGADGAIKVWKVAG